MGLSDELMKTEQVQDFKYIMQDTGNLYFGKELTYREIYDNEEVAFKFKAVINTYIQKEIDLNMKMVDHLAHISKEDFSYLVYDQLKLQVRFYYGVEKKNLFGKVKTKWIHTSCKWKDFVETYQDKVRSGEVTIEDVSISKFALMVFSL